MPTNTNQKTPAFRKLRGYAFDPSLSLKPDTSAINDILYKVVWEQLEPGPIGEYIEVLDYDPTVKQYYSPVNLNEQFILAQDGFDPSESNPQFHQQMVYAVAMTTIKNFEQALGRKLLWAPRLLDKKISGKYEAYVQRLRIYPHAIREANAYYSPLKKAILFGYFSAMPADEVLQMPNSLVFTCLSHDIIAHEVTHAILDGLHRNYNEATNPDVLAFHEAFADIVALFQHFSFPEVLKHQIAKTRGDLSSQNLLGQLAQQFGSAIGSYGSLRDAIGSVNETTKLWEPAKPNPADYRNVLEPHARGSILVSAIFEAFTSIYKRRAADLLRIASNGTGILPQGELHPDLVNRLANEAAKAAGHVLTMCIRAIDYCPPVDINFGDFLRAIITADVEMVAEDSKDYRLAFIDAFRRRGIYPSGIKTLSVESLQQPLLNIEFKIVKNIKSTSQDFKPLGLKAEDHNTDELIRIIADFLRDYASEIKYLTLREEIYNCTKKYITGQYAKKEPIIWGLHRRLGLKFSDSKDFSALTGLAFFNNFKHLGIDASKLKTYNGPSFEIINLRLVNRVGPNGSLLNQVIFSIIQTSTIQFDGESYTTTNKGNAPSESGVINFKGGSTLIFDLDSLALKYAISKPLLDIESLDKDTPILNLQRLKAQYQFMNNTTNEMGLNEYDQYFGHADAKISEPFAFLHQH